MVDDEIRQNAMEKGTRLGDRRPGRAGKAQTCFLHEIIRDMSAAKTPACEAKQFGIAGLDQPRWGF
ncbi:hypothetical protein DK26_09110 [Bosea sp. WAO]|nr:hypothetical protein DK26_09110 [Bosea sp. WAO]